NLKRQLNTPVVCMLQGEDSFLDSLPEPHSGQTWKALAERCRDVDLFIAPSRYFGELMTRRLNLTPDRVRVVYNGINLDGYKVAPLKLEPPVIGYFARMCREKGLHTLVDAFIQIKKRNKIPGVQLFVGGGLGPADESFVAELKQLLQQHGQLEAVQFFPNVTREEKQEFYRKLTVFSVPALYGEAFGLYLVEAWASGIPVVQPRHAAFPELVGLTGAGEIVDGNADALSLGLENLLLNDQRLSELGKRARRSVEEQLNVTVMTQGILDALTETIARCNPQNPTTVST
ncbi:MAG: glgA, partial [Verrucomicrobiales bacterium]|nr:glgA [Verrucomicrobiales bacterium]